MLLIVIKIQTCLLKPLDLVNSNTATVYTYIKITFHQINRLLKFINTLHNIREFQVIESIVWLSFIKIDKSSLLNHINIWVVFYFQTITEEKEKDLLVGSAKEYLLLIQKQICLRKKTNIFLCTKNNDAHKIVHIYIKVNNGF